MPTGRGVARRTKGQSLAVYISHPAVTFGRDTSLYSREKLFKGGIFVLDTKNAISSRRSKQPKLELECSIFSRAYWREASYELSNLKTLVFAAMIIAMRVAVKLWKVPISAGLSVTFDCYVNALGSIVYGPVVGLLVGAISDTLGCIIHPTGPYFFPFIFVEMSSSFIFALFFWRRKISVGKVLCSKFVVNLFCNMFLTSVFMKWMYVSLGDPKAITYNVFNLSRIAKNLILFPIESMLIVLIMGAFIPLLRSLKVIPKTQKALIVKVRHIVMIAVITLISIGLILFYIFFLKDFIQAHNIKFF